MKNKFSLIVAVLASAMVIVCGSPISEESEEDIEDFVEPHIVKGEIIDLSREYFVGFEFFRDFQLNFFCSGVRLNEKWMIAPAECLDRRKSTHIGITTVHNHSKLGAQYKNISLIDFKVHPKFNEKTKAHNIALLRSLDQRWTKKSLHPTLPAKSEKFSTYLKKNAVVTGYNFSRDAIGISEVIKVASMTVRIEQPKACKGLYQRTDVQADSICTIPLVGKGLGDRDTGAPLVISNSNENKLIGIAMRVPTLKKEGQPIVFAKISPYLDWIGQVTGIKIRN